MNIKLTKHIFGDFEIPQDHLVGCYDLNPVSRPELSPARAADKISNPAGSARLSVLAENRRNVIIVTDDNTRETPLKKILPHVLKELHDAGLSKKQISFLIGLGTHRPMTPDEIVEKFGKDIFESYAISNHQWDNPQALVSLGMCDLGFEVVVNRKVMEADLLISIGSIVPHATTGFSGGGKTIVTGIAGERTIENTHWMALDYPMRSILGNYDNKVQQTIGQLAEKVNLQFIINSILFDGDKIYDIVAGSTLDAHKKGSEICKSLYGAVIPRTADIVVAEAFPADIDLRQAIKAICAADIVCNDNGVIILPAQCPEGIAPQFPEFEQYGFSNPEKLYHEVNDGSFKQKLMAYTLVAIGRILKRVKCILISPNIDKLQAEKLGFTYAENMSTAMQMAYELTCGKSDTVVLKNASVLLPVIESQDNYD